ncbi:uncharacterized protein [Aristolochia californica]|uniref:uncharacterized protein isoform X2 n=1 Tax=Aristolochia californica TaxID=171875 RepID=UPI0035DC3028
MKILPSPSPLFSQIPSFRGLSLLGSPSNPSKPPSFKVASVSVKPPPPGFDYRKEVFNASRAAISVLYPELLDLADNGSIVLIEKSQFGPVPVWRTAFVEPEEIWLVGTSHISEESAKNVERVVRAVKPDRVVVELCRSRAGIMYTAADGENSSLLKSNMFSLSGPRFFGAVSRSINLGGQTALALRLLLAVYSSKISADTNRSFGDEFRSARKASEEVGAQIVLGDRPIEITYLAWSLKRSKAVNNMKRVVGVIGKGHMNGVIHALMADQGDLRFRDLTGRRPESSNGWVNSIIKGLVRDTLIGFILWIFYEQVRTMIQ